MGEGKDVSGLGKGCVWDVCETPGVDVQKALQNTGPLDRDVGN